MTVFKTNIDGGYTREIITPDREAVIRSFFCFTHNGNKYFTDHSFLDFGDGTLLQTKDIEKKTREEWFDFLNEIVSAYEYAFPTGFIDWLKTNETWTCVLHPDSLTGEDWLRLCVAIEDETAVVEFRLLFPDLEIVS